MPSKSKKIEVDSSSVCVCVCKRTHTYIECTYIQPVNTITLCILVHLGYYCTRVYVTYV
jgi:hypothetical protein